MLAKTGLTLSELVAGLPQFHKAEVTVHCPTERKGSVMRAVSEHAVGLDTDLTEGVRVNYPDGWALVLPHASEPNVTVWAEAESPTSAQDRAQHWLRVATEAIEA